MSFTVKRHGRYRLYETDSPHRKRLLLDNTPYDWVSGSREDLLTLSKLTGRGELIGQGDYLVLQAHGEEGWSDGVDYLALSDQGAYYCLYKMDDGLPTDHRQQQPILALTRTISRRDLPEQIGI